MVKMDGKKKPLLVAGLILMLLIPSAISQSAPPVDAYKTDLIADGGSDGMKYDAGDIFVWMEDETLFVKFVTNGDWSLFESHLHIDKSGLLDDGIDDIPTNRKGSPKVGRFEYQTFHNPGVSDILFSEFIGEIEADQLIYISAHAVVNSTIYGMESSWGDGIRFTDKGSWAMYFTFTDLVELTAELDELYFSREVTSFPLWGSANGGIEPYTFSWDLDNDLIFDDAFGDFIIVDGTNFGWISGSYNNVIRLKVEDSTGRVSYDESIVYFETQE
jgi:hypothetical protein